MKRIIATIFIISTLFSYCTPFAYASVGSGFKNEKAAQTSAKTLNTSNSNDKSNSLIFSVPNLTNTSTELASDEYLRLVDLTNYQGNAFQFKVTGGKIVGFYKVNSDGSQGSAFNSAKEITPSDWILEDEGLLTLGGTAPKLYIKINSTSQDYQLTINDATADTNSFDFSDMPISAGNFLNFTISPALDTASYIKVNLEADKDYAYCVNDYEGFQIIGPDGTVIRNYADDRTRGYFNVSSTFRTSQSGIYTIKSNTENDSFGGLLGIKFQIYEVVNLNGQNSINFNNSNVNDRDTEKAVAVNTNTSNHLYFNTDTHTGESDVQHFMGGVDVTGLVKSSEGSDNYDESNYIVDDFLDYNAQNNHIVNNGDGTYMDIIHFSNTKYYNNFDIAFNGNYYTPKTGVYAKDKIKQLSATDRLSSLFSDPVDSFAGDFKDSRTLLSYAGNNPLVFRLNYDSIANDSKALGGGFTHNFESYVDDKGSTVDVYWNPNSLTEFNQTDTGYEVANSSQKGIELIKNSDGTYQVTDKLHQKYTFNPSGQITEFIDKMGLKTDYTYTDGKLSKVSNAKGQEFNFSYDSSGKLSLISDGTGRQVIFGYSNGCLTSVKTPRGFTLNVTYTQPFSGDNVVSEMSYNGSTLIQNSYDSEGRVTKQTDAKYNSTNFTYDEYTNNDQVTTTIQSGNRIDTVVHDKDGDLLSHTNGDGNKDTYTYDSNGNMLSHSDGNGKLTTYEYNSINQLTKETNPEGKFKSYEYDSSGNVTKIITEDGKSANYAYDGGKMVSSTDKTGVETDYTFDQFGNVKTISRGDNNTVNAYDSQGYLISVTKNGQTTNFKNDGLGRITETDLPDGKSVKTTYDADSNVLSETKTDGTTVTYVYDAFGNKTQYTDENGVVTTYTYDSIGNLTKQVMGNRETDYQYNSFNQLTYQSGANGGSFTYDNAGRLLSSKDNDGKGYSLTYDAEGHVLTKATGTSVEKYEYDDLGNVISYTDGNGNKTAYAYDSVGNKISETLPSGQVKTFGYDDLGHLISSKDANGNQTSFKYDSQGHLIEKDDPNGAVSKYTYDDDGHLISSTDALGNTRTNVYNDLGQLAEVKDALNRIIYRYDYNDLGKMSQITDGNGDTTKFTYDNKGNLIDTLDAYGNTVQSNAYDDYNDITSQTDGLGNKTINAYNSDGNLTKLTDPLGYSTSYSYTSAGRLSSSTNAVGTGSNNSYDSVGNISGISMNYGTLESYSRDNNWNVTSEQFGNDASNTTSYQYNNDNELNKVTNALGQPINYTYDGNGNVTEKKSPEADVTSTYDMVNNKLTSNSSNESISRTYDLLGRVISKTENGKTIKYEYDQCGNLVKLTYPNDKDVTYTYDVMGNMLSVEDWNGHTTSYKYDKDNRLIETDHWNGTSEIRTYDNNGNVTKIQNLNALNSISEYNYVYDANGNIKNDNGKDLTFDKLNRLTSSGNNSYSYTANGNISKYTLNGVSHNLNYGSFNQLTSIDWNSTSVDADGNLTGYTLNNQSYSATYDSQNRLTTFDGTSYQYDSEGDRVSQSNGDNQTNYVVDNDSGNGSRVLSSTANDGTRYYIYGVGLIGEYNEGGQFLTHEYDLRGSTTSLTDETGLVLGRASYDDFGQVINKDSGVDTVYLYNGKYGVQTDGNGLYYMQTRYYNPDLLRFMNRDIVTGSIIDSQSLNQYAFVNGNPISYVDPFGTAREWLGINSWQDGIHFALDVAGAIPVVGSVFDATNAVYYLSEGNYTNALISGVCVIPFLGDYGIGLKNADKFGTKVFEQVSDTRELTGLQGVNLQYFSKASKPDFYVKPNGDAIPSTGYRYMDSMYAETTMKSMKAPGSYITFTKFDSASEARNSLQIATKWSDARLRGEFDTLQVIDDLKVPLWHGGDGPELEPLTKAYPENGVGGLPQLVTRSEINFTKVKLIGE